MKTSQKQTTKGPLRTAVVVMGMHRSGTSALAGVLHRLGCGLPVHLMPATVANSKGYFESYSIQRFNDAELEKMGSSWSDWRPVPEEAQTRQSLDDAAALLQSEFEDHKRFLIKDPRMCRLGLFWDRAIRQANVRPVYILTHRSPLDVVISLDKRERVFPEHGMLLWLRHVLDAEHATRGKARIFTSFAQLMADWETCVQRITTAFPKALLKLTDARRTEIDGFLSGELYHHQSPPEMLLDDPTQPEWVRTTFAILERWVNSAETPDDYAVLDQVRDEFDTACSGFAMLATLTRRPGPSENERDLEKHLSAEKADHSKTQEALIEQLAQARAFQQQEQSLSQEIEAERQSHQDVSDTQAQEIKSLCSQLDQTQQDLAKVTETLQANLLKTAALEQKQTLQKIENQSLNAKFEAKHQGMLELRHKLQNTHNALIRKYQDLEQHSNDTMVQLGQSTRDLEAAQKALETALSTKATLAAKIVEMNVENARLSAEMNRLAVEIEALMSSTSWRVTTPLRRVGQMFRRT